MSTGCPRPTASEHIDAMKALVETTGGTPAQVKSHPISFGSGEWTCVVGEFEDGSRMVAVAKWRDGAIAEDYIWLCDDSPSVSAPLHRSAARRGATSPAELGDLPQGDVHRWTPVHPVV